MPEVSAADLAAVTAQLQRTPRDVARIAHRCPCGNPAVVATAPRLADGTPFPTTYYLTCPRATSACSTLESQGLMAEMARRLAEDGELAQAYRRAHEAYLADRSELGDVAEIAGTSAGGMPDRVKCLHALVGHSLAAGPGVNPLGDEALARIGPFWSQPCLPAPPGRRVAVVDCGTNSIRLLIAEADPDAGLRDIDRRVEIVRLGQGVDATRRLHPDAVDRALAATEQYARLVRDAGVTPADTRFVTTSAVRDVAADDAGRRAFFDGVQQRLGVRPEVVSGDTEARLSFAGALSRVQVTRQPVLVMDVGGGSTELVLGTADGVVQAAVSLDIGSVRLTERFLADSPPAPADLARAGAHVDALLAGCGLDLRDVGSWVGVAGTVTTIAALQLGRQTPDPEQVHGAVLPAVGVADLLARLASLSAEQIRGLAGIHPQRADVITAGALVVSRVAAAVGAEELVVSLSDILDGVALDLLRPAGGAQIRR